MTFELALSVTLILFAVIVALTMLVLVIDWARRTWIEYRELRDSYVRERPQPDPRAARHRNFTVGGDAKL